MKKQISEWSLGHDGRSCQRCHNRSEIFGAIDAETGWVGYCQECNAQWKACRFNCTLRSCSRKFASQFLTALGLRPSNCVCIRQCLGYCPSSIRTDLILMHKLNVLKVLCLAAPIMWYTEDDEEAEAHRLAFPCLRTLQDIFCDSDSFQRLAFGAFHRVVFGLPTLLDCVQSYLIGGDINVNRKSSRSCSYCTEVPELAINNAGNCESCWEAYKMADGTLMFVNTETDERFGSKHISDWRRYWHYDMHCEKKFWWCCGKRWFFEPSVTIAAKKNPMKGFKRFSQPRQ